MDSSVAAMSSTSSPSPLTDMGLSTTHDEPDPTIVEALSGSKDRLFVLKLGDDFDSLLTERGNTPGKRCTYAPPSSYQRLLVHRCAQYYKLTIEADAKSISVMLGPESRSPKCRISDIVPMEQAPAPAFKIMRRTADERARAKQPGRADSTGDDQTDGTEDPKRRAQMTIEERTAAYEQARSRIFQGFQEKEGQPSPTPTRRDSANSEPRWVDKQRRSDFSSSSRGSPVPQDMAAIPASYYPPMLFNPNAPSAPPPQPYDTSIPYMYGPQYYPMYAYYPQPQYDPRQAPMGYPPQVAYPFPPQHAATWPPPQPQPQPQHGPETRHAFPQMQPNRHMHMAPSDPFPPHQYMQPYQYAGFVHQPVLVPTPPEAPGSGHSSRSGSRNGHGNGHVANGSNGGAKGPRSSVGPWSASTVATPMRSVTGVNRRLSTSSSSTSAYSGSAGGAGSGSRTPADETASIASSASSSSSRRTYTSTSTTSKHPLPPRPDWAVGIMADSSLSRTTSSSSSDSRLRMTSRSSSGNQIPRAGTAAANVSDFPPLNGNGSGNEAALNGAWGRDGSPANLFGNNPMNPPGAPPPPPPRRFEETDSIGRPVPKSFGLYNPHTGAGPAALPAQVRTFQEGGTLSTDALADQVSKLNVSDGPGAFP
ncbi:unnamed protein product [Rhizoctonia solani]|uniref:SUZ domain-containing protein n=1 Tax=Rhizoctonia solani TaxID=456999 RepID=A0A8H3B8L9_9AGAM|nr:unnamed protein product [Rhizoctonia solani]CAE6474671.1 unnamed protein product [Rhizoctonia solani]